MFSKARTDCRIHKISQLKDSLSFLSVVHSSSLVIRSHVDYKHARTIFMSCRRMVVRRANHA